MFVTLLISIPIIIWVTLSLTGFYVVAKDTIESQGIGNHSNTEMVLFGVIGLIISFLYSALLMIKFLFEPNAVADEVKDTFKNKKFRGGA